MIRRAAVERWDYDVTPRYGSQIVTGRLWAPIFWKVWNAMLATEAFMARYRPQSGATR